MVCPRWNSKRANALFFRENPDPHEKDHLFGIKYIFWHDVITAQMFKPRADYPRHGHPLFPACFFWEVFVSAFTRGRYFKESGSLQAKSVFFTSVANQQCADCRSFAREGSEKNAVLSETDGTEVNFCVAVSASVWNMCRGCFHKNLRVSRWDPAHEKYSQMRHQGSTV